MSESNEEPTKASLYEVGPSDNNTLKKTQALIVIVLYVIGLQVRSARVIDRLQIGIQTYNYVRAVGLIVVNQ
jgi:hypothetical protein